MKHANTTSHAVALADHFVTLILEGEPELLIRNLDELDDTDVRQVARRLAIFRLALIEELLEQPHDQEDEAENEEDRQEAL